MPIPAAWVPTGSKKPTNWPEQWAATMLGLTTFSGATVAESISFSPKQLLAVKQAATILSAALDEIDTWAPPPLAPGEKCSAACRQSSPDKNSDGLGLCSSKTRFGLVSKYKIGFYFRNLYSPNMYSLIIGAMWVGCGQGRACCRRGESDPLEVCNGRLDGCNSSGWLHGDDACCVVPTGPNAVRANRTSPFSPVRWRLIMAVDRRILGFDVGLCHAHTSAFLNRF